MVVKLDLAMLGTVPQLSLAEQITGNTSKHNMWNNSVQNLFQE